MATISELIESALLHYEAGQFDQAIALNQRALEQEPRNIVAHMNLGAALQRIAKLEEAAECYRTALSIRPGEFKVLTNLGTVRRAQGRFDEALDACRQALAA